MPSGIWINLPEAVILGPLNDTPPVAPGPFGERSNKPTYPLCGFRWQRHSDEKVTAIYVRAQRLNDGKKFSARFILSHPRGGNYLPRPPIDPNKQRAQAKSTGASGGPFCVDLLRFLHLPRAAHSYDIFLEHQNGQRSNRVIICIKMPEN